MRFRIYIIALGLLVPALHIGAQGNAPLHVMDSVVNRPLDENTPLVFEPNEIRGERLSEDDSPKAYTFSFRNTSQKTVVITRVDTSCGCAIASFEQDAIQPGQQGKITIVYNPKDHPGKFTRRIFVYTNTSERPAARLTIAGEVTPTADQWRDYPVVMGSLRAKRKFLSFTEVTATTRQTERIECANSGNSPLRLSAMAGMAPIWLSFRTEPEVIAPGEVADLIVEVNGKLLPPGQKGRLEHSLLLDGINIRPSLRSLRIIVEVK